MKRMGITFVNGPRSKTVWLACLICGVLASWAPAASFSAPQRLGVVDKEAGKEISGLAASRRHPGVLWVNNDGAKERLFAISTNGNALAAVKLPVQIADAEDLAMGPGPGGTNESWIYLGDIGDNERKRASVQVLRFPEPVLPPQTKKKLPVIRLEKWETLVLRYPDGPHNAEALLVDNVTGDLFIATKEPTRARVYRAARGELRPGLTTRLTLVRDLAMNDISGGGISPDGGFIVLRRERTAWAWKREVGQTVVEALQAGAGRVPVVGPPLEPNGETIAFAADGGGYFTISEGERPAIYFFKRSVVD